MLFMQLLDLILAFGFKIEGNITSSEVHYAASMKGSGSGVTSDGGTRSGVDDSGWKSMRPDAYAPCFFKAIKY
jgi:hypothetical protein